MGISKTLPIQPQRKSRGATINPTGRFEPLTTKLVPQEWMAWEEPEWQSDRPLQTQYLRDPSRSVVATNDSPDVGFSASINPYRGCEHGCIYCFARPTHEYLGFSAGLDFETKIMVKEDAPELLRARLMSKSWQPQVLGMSGVTDCYQPVERKLRITRRVLEVLAEFRNPVTIITKNALVRRDTDILAELAAHNAVTVNMSVTTLDAELARVMEPRTSQPKYRLEAIRHLTAAGVPVHVIMGPVIPGLTDHEIPRVLKAAAEAGALSASYVMLRLPHGVKDLFMAWLDEHYPLRKDKVLSKMRQSRGGKLYDATYGSRMHGEGVFAEHIAEVFETCRKKYGLTRRSELSTAAFWRPSAQMELL